MARLRASFWENPSEIDANTGMYENDEEEEEDWEREVVGSLESLANVSVEEGYAPYLSHDEFS